MIDRVGVIGLGRMGLPMVRRLIARGHQAFVHDIDRSRLEAAAALGATACADPAEVAARSRLAIVIVGFDAEVLDVVTSANGLLKGAGEGFVIAVASTVLPETMRRIADEAEALGRNVSVLDIPLCRGEAAAEAGTLLLLAGGDEAVYEACRPVFQAFASDLFRLGALGAGQVGKMINNLLLWACTSANYEGLKLGAALGVDVELLRQALVKSSGANWALETWGRPRPMPWAEKDMTLVLHAADACRLSLPLCGVVKEVVKAIKIERGLATPVART